MNRRVGLLLLLALGCTRFAEDTAPRHDVIILERKGGEPPELRPTFLAWVSHAVDCPGSSITLCEPSSDGVGSCSEAWVIPAWRSPVLRAKAAFVRTAPGALDAILRARSEWKRPPLRIGEHATITLLTSQNDRDPAWLTGLRGAPRHPRLHTVVLVDVSASTQTCDASELTTDFDRFLARGGVAGLSSFTVWRVGYDLATTTEVFRFVMPKGDGPVRRTLAVLSARSELQRLTITSDATAGSALDAALYVSANDWPKEGDRQLILHSDMQLVRRGRWDFQREVPTGPQFVEALRRAHMALALDGATVEIYGTHFRAAEGRTISARRDAEIKTTWQEALEAFGARAVYLSSRCASAEEGE